ncbi:Hydrogenase isoenzymes nickel incorporation protein HypB [Methylacidimicrobium cyclopophantes]|uniref:Hydrogenase isoenzymes nickel incorporation protein HypB n=1 Tax=Methylacidimicrobium cyclopophantes TaxID=1041766 RepID=A0A5E6MBM6_9BACT|nr:hydrogenase nickel incorporation protein HypB [Methylacidimicrobium cyclopophantes]VVM06599.1 Hydrogenase isoenzymes nickel incorporation protein HypB [Methylacidimicrobium cyclopophantes]
MCATCGCGGGEGEKHEHFGHAHEHPHGANGGRRIDLEADLLEANAAFARRNRELFRRSGVFAVNLISSPGSGKTTLLVRTLEALRERIPMAVVEGDQQSELDAERIRAAGVPALQIQTGRSCHLDAHVVGHALEQLSLPAGGILWIENVGNLICPALFDLGEGKRVVMLSVTEGEDKPRKYPEAFHGADLLLLSKGDLLPYVDFSVDRCAEFAHRLRPGLDLLLLSAKTGEGMGEWLRWVEEGWLRAKVSGRPEAPVVGER